MSTASSDNTATTWRNLADQLTDDQRASLDHLETSGQVPAALLLDYARRYIEVNLANMAYDDVPIPAGATFVDRWQPHADLGWSRSVVWWEFMSVGVDGWQRCDGTIERGISVYLDEGQTLSSKEARELATLLSQAADALGGLQ